MNSLTMLGTGSAFPTRSYHSCFLLSDGTATLLTDGGGGMELLDRIKQAGSEITAIDALFVTHVHTDHIFGIVWLIRRLTQFALEESRAGILPAATPRQKLPVYGNAEVIHALREICRLTFLPAYFNKMNEIIDFRTVEAGSEFSVGQMQFRVIDCCSRGCDQSGFIATMPDGVTLACLGDESLTDRNGPTVEAVDWLLCGAYCSFADREIFRPYEKHHHTVADVARMASRFNVGNLIICHCEDRDLANRAARYAAEAAEFFSGQVITPLDLQEILLR